MENRKRYFKKRFVSLMLTVFLLIVISILKIGNFGGNFEELFNTANLNDVDIETSNNVETNALANLDQKLSVHFIDVGQADSIFIKQGSHYMLIDGGNNDDGDLVVNYLKSEGVDRLEYIIATHPHEDHIGGLDDVINNFEVEKVLMPNKTTTTKTYENFLIAIKNRQEKMREEGKDVTLKKIPKVNETYTFGNASFTVLAPNSKDYGDNYNNYSIVIKMIFGDNSFLFTGDAEITSEKEIISAGYNLKSDLLKVGHHGSHTSTSKEFLEAVSPKYAVISVEKNNKYNLPKKSVMNRLKDAGVVIYRTDETGSIVATSDGKNITFDKSPCSYSYMK